MLYISLKLPLVLIHVSSDLLNILVSLHDLSGTL